MFSFMFFLESKAVSQRYRKEKREIATYHHICLRTRVAPRRNCWAPCCRSSMEITGVSNVSTCIRWYPRVVIETSPRYDQVASQPYQSYFVDSLASLHVARPYLCSLSWFLRHHLPLAAPSSCLIAVVTYCDVLVINVCAWSFSTVF